MSIVSDGPVPPNSVEVPLHRHPLFRANPALIYKRYGGNWACDNCKKEYGSAVFPYHCNECEFDLCEGCSKGIIVDYIHSHPLYYVNVTQQQISPNLITKCTVCERTIIGMGQTHALCCSLCDFYLCLSCGTEKQHPIHVHPLKTVNTSLIYPQTNGMWGCDVCGRTSRFNERYSRHCSSCEFDVCSSCMKEYVVSCHNHPLVRVDANVVYAQFSGRWKCDNCEVIFSNASIDNKPWHCQQCEYDLCHNCMQQVSLDLNSEYDVAGPPSNTRNMTNAAIISPHLARLSYDEPKDPVTFSTTEKGKMVTSTEGIDDGDECIICSENPKNATLIHGDTGHLCCCWSCAQVLKSRGDHCPICRQKIDHVIRQFKA